MRAPGPLPPPSRRLPAILAFTLVLLAVVVALQTYRNRTPPPSTARGPLSPTASTLTPEVLQEFLAIEQREQAVSTQAWAAEGLAQQWATVIEGFWNHLNQHRGQLSPLLALPARSVSMPQPGPPVPRPLGILSWHASDDPTSPRVPLTPSDPRLAAWVAEGWGLEQSEWRHVRFEPALGARPASSVFEVHLHLTRPSPPARAQIDARVRIHWPIDSPSPGSNPLGDWTVEALDVIRRDGPPAFQEAARIEVPPFPRTTWIDPLIAVPASPLVPQHYLLAARNLRVVRAPDGTWSTSPLSPHHPGLIFTALLADFDQDGHQDLLCVVRGGLVLLPGGNALAFDTPARPVWKAPERLHYAQAITCGDIDNDGDLDVFIGQYRTPYEGGQMPRPFFDALDGPPAYLLRNLGDGRFEDITPTSGLAPKRHRRTYGASFVDLDGDRDLDLLVSSDFAGVDVHANDGQGLFVDRTAQWLDDPKAFGMSHLVSDFDADGHLDVFVAGMPQPTADRLQALSLERPGHETWSVERTRVVVGNRLFFGGREGFRQRPGGSSIARAGWAWSAAELDLNNDRLPELYVVNGHETRQSVRDYEREFWLHDIYVGDSTSRPAVEAYFSSKFATTRSQGWSYGGYDKNRLFLNLDGSRFLEVAHVLGLALEVDCRNVLAEDFDGDGDADLLVTTSEVWPNPRQTLRLLENTLPTLGHWIEIQPGPMPRNRSGLGATVVLNDHAGTQIRALVTGAGYRSQPAPVARFGLGQVTVVDEVQVRWPDGEITHARNLPANRRHILPAPAP